MSRLAIIEIQKEELKFSAGHYMLVSDCARETFHGHDYQVQVSFLAEIIDNGMAFDCREYKLKLAALCAKLDYHFILPGQSPYLKIEIDEESYHVHLGSDKTTFAKKDAIVLPITNVTLEELSFWFIQELTRDAAEIERFKIHEIIVKVFNGRCEAGGAIYRIPYGNS